MVSLRPLKGGEIVLRDSPIVLYSAFPFLSDDPQNNNNNNGYCSNCFTTVSNQSQSAICSTCRSQFCTLDCQSMASATSHTPWACQALARFRHYVISTDHKVRLDLQVQARFLVSAYNLASVSPDRFRTLLSLQGSVSDAGSDSDSVFLHSFVSSVSPPPRELGFSLEMTRILLAKDKVNAFGLMEPFSEDREERSVRAYGIYPVASFFNHDCLPNACRFDYVDVAAGGAATSNTDMTIRMIHDVPEGREICLSYFPVNLKYAERQKRLREDYGFDCDCDRCKVEANWSDCDEEVDDENKNEGDGEESMEEDDDEEMEGGDGDGDEMKGGGEEDFPHAYFFLTYMCDRKNCWGTLAPVAESVAVMECNVCGSCRNLDQV